LKTFWTRRTFIKSGIFLSTAALLLDAFWIEKFFIETNRFSLKSRASSSLGLKFIQISDLHLKSVNSQLKRLAKQINAQNPDLIFLTGDAVESNEQLPVLDAFLKLLRQDIQKVAILGNWEYWGNVNLSDLQTLYMKHNCDLLVNQARQYQIRGNQVLITGVDDFIGGNASISLAMQEYKASDCHIILNHCPQYAESISNELAPEMAASAIISGHTHGGQINLFGYIPFLPRGSGKYIKGWYTVGDIDLYVSKGLGTSLLPIRFGSRAEIAVFEA
jgi:predicted MPP superfamily phosphohydrolase